MNKKYQLLFIQNLCDFPDGTLFELENQLVSHAQISGAVNERRQEIADWEYVTKGYLLPDRGDGVRTILPEKNTLPSDPFAENIPPAKGVIQVTRTTTRSLRFPDAEAPSSVPVGILERNRVTIFQNIHFQRLYIELPPDREEIAQITVFDKVKQWETECYYSPTIRKEEGKWRVDCEFSHITFGFYEVQVQFTSGWYYQIDLIKHYPDYLKEKYLLLIGADNSMNIASRPTFTPLKEIGFSIPNFSQATAPVSPDKGVNYDVLNEALALTTEWGENFRKPIAERLQQKYPEISFEQGEQLQTYCQEVESYMYGLGEDEWTGKIQESAMIQMAQRKYPWVKMEHWLRLKNIAFYYARR